VIKKRFLLFTVVFLFALISKGQTDSVLSKKFPSAGFGTLHSTDIYELLFVPSIAYNFNKHEVIAGLLFNSTSFDKRLDPESNVVNGAVLSYRYFLTRRFKLFEVYIGDEFFYYTLRYGFDHQFGGTLFKTKLINTNVDNFLVVGANLNFTNYWHANIALGFGKCARENRETFNGVESYRNTSTEFANLVRLGVEYNFIDVYRKLQRKK